MENTNFVHSDLDKTIPESYTLTTADTYSVFENNIHSYGSTLESESGLTAIGFHQIYDPSIMFTLPDGKEYLKISKDGFFVRGQKLDQDESEARKLFDSFTEFFKISLGQIPLGYYDNANGLSGATLKTALYNIIKNHTDMGYNGLYACYTTTDNLPGQQGI